jgi:hypothetical protein
VRNPDLRATSTLWCSRAVYIGLDLIAGHCKWHSSRLFLAGKPVSIRVLWMLRMKQDFPVAGGCLGIGWRRTVLFLSGRAGIVSGRG